MAPEYLAEEYRALTDQDGSVSCIIIRVSPYHPSEPGIKFCLESKRDVSNTAIVKLKYLTYYWILAVASRLYNRRFKFCFT